VKKTIVIVLLLIALLAAACQTAAPPPLAGEGVGKQITVPGGSYTDVSVAELQTMLAHKDFTFVNVHIPFEGNIAKTDLSIPYDQIEQNLDKLPADKNAKIVLYCRSDRMSNIAAKNLVGLGYTNVWNLDGGMLAWEQARLPLEH
jgi:rhodanese-related sulfurtransferase